MFVHPEFDPIALHLGPLAIRWYGLMYLTGFLAVLLLGRYRIKHGANAPINNQQLDDLLFYGVLGVVLGGRLGYVLFYKPDYYWMHPLEIFYVWEGGMAFHGGFVGVMAAMWLYVRKHGIRWLNVMDFLAPLTAIGLGAGRLGNFINGELWGRVTDVPWAVAFPQHDMLPRHPSQLYQFALEGVVMFLLLWLYSSKPRPAGAVSGLFLIAYGLFRFLVEFVREPDAFMPSLALGLTMGQWLSVPMILIGVGLLRWSYVRK
ncbi:MAG: prolipoprotein diacylglyceryl transferase [Burkholderiales bacterium]|nr:prolipoprotein diacylglyceryl transferase [Burkholderiales bacterium]